MDIVCVFMLWLVLWLEKRHQEGQCRWHWSSIHQGHGNGVYFLSALHFQTITEVYETTTTRTSDYGQAEPSTPALVQPQPAKPTERKKVVRKKVDSSKFMTPYIEHSQKMQDLFSSVSIERHLLCWLCDGDVTDFNQLWDAGWFCFSVL